MFRNPVVPSNSKAKNKSVQILKMFLLLSLVTGCMEQFSQKKAVSPRRAQAETVTSKPVANAPQASPETPVSTPQVEIIQNTAPAVIKAQAVSDTIAAAETTLSPTISRAVTEAGILAVDTQTGTSTFQGQIDSQILQKAPPKSYFLVITANWTDPGFGKEARTLGEKILAEEGKWNVQLLDENYPIDPGQSKMKAIVQKAIQSAKRGDTVWLEVLGHGSEINNSGGANYVGLLAQSNNLSIQYPYIDKFSTSIQSDMMGTHFVDVHMNRPNGPSNLTARDMYEIASDLAAKGISAAIVDHSCYAGASVKLLEPLEKNLELGNHICAISSTGVITPGKTDGPFVSSFLNEANINGVDRTSLTMNDYANFISQKYYAEHNTGSRLQSIGYKTACTHTMALRDTLSAASSAYFSYWDWMRTHPSHVARNPERYTYIDFDPAPVNLNNPRNYISDGLVRWFNETNLKMYTENAFAPWLIAESSMLNFAGIEKNTSDSYLIYLSGVILLGKILNYRDRVVVLDNDLTQTSYLFSGYRPYNNFPYIPLPTGPVMMTTDAYLREVFTKYCLCKNPAKAGASANCWQSLPPVDFFFAQNPNIICDSPSYFRSFVLQGTGKLISLDNLNYAETEVINYSKVVSKRIQNWEVGGCVSSACQAIKP